MLVLALWWVAGPRLALRSLEPPTSDGYVEVAKDESLAYEVLGDSLAERHSPIVFVHGGPGVATRTADRAALATLSSRWPVVLYDQIGAGASTRLRDVEDYTLERAVADLEALRLGLDIDAMVLVGHSWGGTVAAHYASRHPEKVQALILAAPGSLDLDPDVEDDPTVMLNGGRRTALYARLAHPRGLFAYGMTVLHPPLAHRLAGDREMDRRFAGLLRVTAPAMYCDPDLADTYPVDGAGYYAHQLPQVRPPAVATGRAGARQVPTLVIKPECDYLPWRVVHPYADAFDARVAYVPDAGHAVHLERPRIFADIVTAFVDGMPVPGELDVPFDMPPGFRGPR